MTENFGVSIIICTLGKSSLKKCLESVYNQKYKNFEVIIVSPNESIREMILDNDHKFSNVKFLISDKASVSRQKNIGIKYASGEIIGFIDDDAIADVEWISHLLRHYDNEDVMCVGGKIVPKFLGDIPEELRSLPQDIFKGFLGETLLEFDESTIINRPVLWGSNISFRKKIFKIIGDFDEDLGKTKDKLLCEEEIDIQSRILHKGYKIVYEPKSFVIHLIDAEKLTKNYFIKRSFWQGFSEVIKIRKYENFQNTLVNLKPLHLDYMNKMKILELFFELSSASSLEKSLSKSYELGRIVGLSSLIRR